jgi:hypothetical protein
MAQTPDAGRGAGVARARAAVADGAHAIVGDAGLDEHVARHLGAALAELLVVVVGAAHVGVALDRDVQPLGMLFGGLCDRADDLAALRLHVCVVGLEQHAIVEDDAIALHFDHAGGAAVTVLVEELDQISTRWHRVDDRVAIRLERRRWLRRRRWRRRLWRWRQHRHARPILAELEIGADEHEVGTAERVGGRSDHAHVAHARAHGERADVEHPAGTELEHRHGVVAGDATATDELEEAVAERDARSEATGCEAADARIHDVAGRRCAIAQDAGAHPSSDCEAAVRDVGAECRHGAGPEHLLLYRRDSDRGRQLHGHPAVRTSSRGHAEYREEDRSSHRETKSAERATC